MIAPLLETRGVVKHFGGTRQLLKRAPVIHAVDDVSLKVLPGETFAIVGESGCGKSTLGRLLVRLLDPTRGHVLYRGRDLGAQSASDMRALRRELQFIFQDPFASLNPRMSVAQIVGEPMWLDGVRSGERRDRIGELLMKVGLRADLADRYPHEFSGGQRQRVSIARALAGRPTLLIGDEPVSALDVSIQAQIVNLLEDLKTEFGLTLVIVSHGLAVIRHMSQRVAVMYLGEIVETAPTDDLFDAPLHPYTQALLSAIPVPQPEADRAAMATRAPIRGDVPSPAAPPSGCRFHTRCPHAQAICSRETPPLERAEGVAPGHDVACHFWRDIRAAGGMSVTAPAPSSALTERLALYRAQQAAEVS